jgi:Zn-dependent protease with chaperone function
LISALSLILAFWRGLASWQATRRLVATWLCHAKAVTLNGVSIPAYCVQHPFPVFAVVGVMRPRLFVAGRVFDSLSHDEISAVVAHETGHLIARDNLKRALMRACRDVLAILPCGQSIERAWAETVEAAADDYAARAGRLRALNLAAALVKIARLVPAGTRLTMPMGGFVLSDDVCGVAWRVRRLIQLAEADVACQKHGPLISSATTWAWWGCLSGFTATITLTAANPRVLMTLHGLIEHMLLALS